MKEFDDAERRRVLEEERLQREELARIEREKQAELERIAREQREREEAERQRQQRQAEIKAQRDAAVETARRNEAQAAEAAALKRKVDELKASNSHYVQKSAKFEVQTPAQQPTPGGPVPDATPQYSGQGQFMPINQQVSAS